MSELLAGFDLLWTFLNAAAQLLLVNTGSVIFGLTLQLFRKVMVPDSEEAKINISVQRSGTYDLIFPEISIEDSSSGTGIQRPVIFREMLKDIIQKR